MTDRDNENRPSNLHVVLNTVLGATAIALSVIAVGIVLNPTCPNVASEIAPQDEK